MPQSNQRGITLKSGFIEGIEKFIRDHPELGWTGVPEALRYTWNKFIIDYGKEERFPKKIK